MSVQPVRDQSQIDSYPIQLFLNLDHDDKLLNLTLTAHISSDWSTAWELGSDWLRNDKLGLSLVT